MRPLLLLPVLAVFLLSCNEASVTAEDHDQWREVLRQKREAVAPDATPEKKQIYADSVRAFVQKYPHHGRGREVWYRMQLEFADELSERGRYHNALRFYQAVVEHDPLNEHARRGIATTVERLAVTRDKLLLLEKGMSKRQVAHILGKPIPGWTVTRKSGTADSEAWYYRTKAGALAAVHFRDGDVIAAEEDSGARIGRLGS